MASTGRASSDFPGLLMQGLPQVFLTPWSVFVLERQDWPWSKWAGAWGLLDAYLPPSRCSAVPNFCPFPESCLVGVILLEVSGCCATCWDYQWESLTCSSSPLTSPTSSPPSFDFLSVTFLTSVHSFPILLPPLVRKMLHLFAILSFMKYSTYNFS